MKIGSFFVAGFTGTEVPEWLKTAILRFDLSGVILFARNLSDAEQVRALCAELQALKKRASLEPLLIGLDHEGGFVARAGHLVPGFPPALAQSTGGTPAITRAFFRHAGLSMRALGLNCDFAPVLDLLPKRGLSSIGIRSFGSDPDTVSAFGAAAFQGLEDSGILACGKHFPGLGSGKLDSHDTLPRVSQSKKKLTAADLLPFRDLVRRGIPLLMTAHAFYPALEREALPATFSETINRDLLRDAMHFKGVLVSDDLGMGAVSERFSLEEASMRAIRCGVDLALTCHAEDGLLRVFEVLQGEFFEKIPLSLLIESSVRRSALSRRLQKIQSRISARTDVRSFQAFQGSKRAIAKKTFRVLRGKSKESLNPADGTITVLALPGWIPRGVEETPAALTRFFELFLARFPGSQLSVLKNAADMKIFSGSSHAENILLLAKDLAPDPAQRAFVETWVRRSGKFACAVCVKNPEDARFLKGFAHTVVCAPGFEEENWEVLLDFFGNPAKLKR